MPRTILVFRLSGPLAQQNLLQEFSLHHDVSASADEVGGSPAIRVETSDVGGAVWDIRATVGMFDDEAFEIESAE